MSVPIPVVETNKGECKIHITLELNINLNEGSVSVKALPKNIPEEIKEESVNWAIPDFDSGTKLNFGKKGE